MTGPPAGRPVQPIRVGVGLAFRRGVRRRTLFLGALLTATTLGTYANSLGNGFVWDDHEIIVQHPASGAPLGPVAVFRSADVAVATEDNPYYRPLTRLLYLVEYRWFGANPAGYHAVSVLAHVAAVLALLLVGTHLFGDSWPAGFAALLLAVHPVNAEAVNFISARNNILATFFVLLGFLAQETGERHARTVLRLAAGLLLLAGLLCKETAVMLLPVLLLRRLPPGASARSAIASRGVAVIPCMAAVAVYLALRASALSGVVGTGLDLEFLSGRLLQDVYILPRYALHLLAPVRLSTGYLVPEALSLMPWWIYPAWAGILAATAAAVWRGGPVVRFGLLWTAVNLLPVANLVPIPSAPMADRYLYLPAVGVWLAAAAGAWELHRRHRRVTVAGGLILLLVLAGITVARNRDWRDDVALFSSAARVEPGFARNHYGLGFARLEAGDLDAAEQAMLRATEIAPHYADALSQLGYIHALRGALDEAERYLTAALQADPRSAVTHFNLALLMEKRGRPQEAALHYRRFLQGIPPRFQELAPRVRERVEQLERE